MNIRDSDATIIFSSDINSKGSLLTTKFCIAMKKPYYVVILDKYNLDLFKGRQLKNYCKKILKWLEKYKPKILNVAGTRESHCFGIQKKVKSILEMILEKSETILEWPPLKTTKQSLFSF